MNIYVLTRLKNNSYTDYRIRQYLTNVLYFEYKFNSLKPRIERNSDDVFVSVFFENNICTIIIGQKPCGSLNFPCSSYTI